MSDEKNVFLMLIRLDANSPSPLGIPEATGVNLGAAAERGRDAQEAMLVGILDPGKGTTSTPLVHIAFDSSRRQTYAEVVEAVETIFERFHGAEGFLATPWRLDWDAQIRLQREIAAVGHNIFGLLESDQADDGASESLRKALKQLLCKPHKLEPHVTIVTNDWRIPWYWMRLAQHTPSLCELRPVGILQLSSRSVREINHKPAPSAARLRALVVGSAEASLPLLEDELHTLKQVLEAPVGKVGLQGVDVVRGRRRIRELTDQFRPSDRKELFRLLHYSGHWKVSADSIELNGEPLDIPDIAAFIEDSILSLDGCSSAGGLQAWADLNSLAGVMLSEGALGCVVSVLPVRNDPIVIRVFWKEFYECILTGRNTVGQALLNARLKLQEATGSVNCIAPLVYQFVGNPSVRVVDIPEMSGAWSVAAPSRG